MKKQDIASLRSGSNKKLATKLKELTTKHSQSLIKLKKGELTQLREPKSLRRDIAVIKTIMSERTRSEKIEKGTK